jgi:hypothetical protein
MVNKKMNINFLPKTDLGKWSVGFILAFFIFLGFFFMFVALGERGGDTFFSNVKLAIPALLTGISGIGTFITGLMSIIGSKERSIFVFLTTMIGLFVLIFVLGEILAPH